jgi:hypothetical protein
VPCALFRANTPWSRSTRRCPAPHSQDVNRLSRRRAGADVAGGGRLRQKHPHDLRAITATCHDYAPRGRHMRAPTAGAAVTSTAPASMIFFMSS